MERTGGNTSVEVVATAPAPLPQASAITPPPPAVAEGAGYQATSAPPLSKLGNSASGVVGHPPEAAVEAIATASGICVYPFTSGVPPGMALKKKRGRPRKYSPDGSVTMPFNPMPISASMPPPGEFTLTSPDGTLMKRGRGKPMGSVNKHPIRSPEIKPIGEAVPCTTTANFTPHILNVAAGEDVTMKIISFSQQGPHAICILSGTGVISNVTLRQPDSSGGTLTYEGRFELLSLSGSFMPNESGGTRSRTGGMSVSLVTPDGRVVGGGIAGLLVAASPVQVVVGSFLPFQAEAQARKHRADSISFSSAIAIPQVCSISMDQTHNIGLGQRSSGPTGKPTASTLHDESWSSLQSVSEAGRNPTDINISLPGD